MAELIKWYLLISLLGLFAFPVSYRLFPMLSDRGWGISRVIGLFLVSYSYWMLASLRILENNAGGALFALGLVLVFGLLLLRGQMAEIGSWLKENRRVLLITEGLFILAFAFWAFMRSLYPDATGTEKPMELAFINSILRSPTFPPADPWLSGYSISYYYFGYVMVALLARLTGVGGSIAFNLGSSLWFALTASASYCIVYTLLSRRVKSPEEKKSPAFWALLAPLFILIVSNLGGTLEMLHARGVFWQKSLDGTMSSAFWTWLDVQELRDPPVEPYSFTPERAGGIWWWRASRILQDYDAVGQPREIIDEFPFFSFYLGDLHPHMLAMPFVILAIAFSMNFFLRPRFTPIEGWTLIEALNVWMTGGSLSINQLKISAWLKRLDFWIAALLMGGLAFLNTWDFPFYVGLFSASYVYLCYLSTGWSKHLIWSFLGLGINLGIAGIILYLPFYLGFSSQAGGFLPSLHFFTRGVHFWLMFAPLLLPILFWLIKLWRGIKDNRSFQASVKFSVGVLISLFLISYLYGMLINSLSLIGNLLLNGQTNPGLMKLGLTLIGWGDAFAGVQGGSGFSEIILSSLANRLLHPVTWVTLGLFLLFVWAALHKSRDVWKDRSEPGIVEKNDSNANFSTEENILNQSDIFVLLLSLLGIGLVLAPEFLYMRDQFGWRMNTIFKFYFQAWILWGLSAAYASVRILANARKMTGWLVRVGWSFLLLMSLAYPFWAVSLRVAGSVLKQMSLDGASYLVRYNPDELEAIQWLKTAPYGIIAEAVGGSYSGYARISTYSGLPTVIGWPGHESQWRGGVKEMGSREADIRNLYQTSRWSEASQIIQNYDIRYIYIGSYEKSLYRINKFHLDPYLNLVFQNESVLIYEVPAGLITP